MVYLLLKSRLTTYAIPEMEIVVLVFRKKVEDVREVNLSATGAYLSPDRRDCEGILDLL